MSRQKETKLWVDPFRLREEMDRLGWQTADLRQAGKGDERKVRRAARIRQETTMSRKWIAEHLAIVKGSTHSLVRFHVAKAERTGIVARWTSNEEFL